MLLPQLFEYTVPQFPDYSRGHDSSRLNLEMNPTVYDPYSLEVEPDVW